MAEGERGGGGGREGGGRERGREEGREGGRRERGREREGERGEFGRGILLTDTKHSLIPRETVGGMAYPKALATLCRSSRSTLNTDLREWEAYAWKEGR